MDSYSAFLFENASALQFSSLEQILNTNSIPNGAINSDLDALVVPNIVPDLGNNFSSTLPAVSQNPLFSVVPCQQPTNTTPPSFEQYLKSHLYKTEDDQYEYPTTTESSEEISCSTVTRTHPNRSAEISDKNSRNIARSRTKKQALKVAKKRTISKTTKNTNISRESSVIDMKQISSKKSLTQSEAGHDYDVENNNNDDDNDENNDNDDNVVDDDDDIDTPLVKQTSIATRTTVRGNVSHTRRCRAKVNNSFERLMDVLPEPPTGTEVRHKAQILAYTIDIYKFLRERNTQLEMQLALSSRQHLHRWVHSVAISTSNLTDALKSFMALICLTKNWKYAELWAPSESSDSQSTCLKYVVGALPPTVHGDELHRLKAYRHNSKQFVFKPRSGVPGRVYLTRRPEWLPVLSDPIAFPRAPHAVNNKVEVTFAVPVIVNGSVRMIVEFYDTQIRDYDHDTVNITNEIAELFGRVFSGQYY